jgi:NADH-quinone oxidoreductase subunit D/NADH-quinone oxidoreductase subunit C/D
MTDAVKEAAPHMLLERFPEQLQADERKSYEGYIVDREHLVEVVTALRDEMGYDFLSSVTGVDYLSDDESFMEVVYHLYRSTGGSALVVKVQVPRDDSVVPSLYDVHPGADFQEREAWDLLGIRFDGHPGLKRILMWEGFEGHPLRKDWKEAYYEEDGKPFGSRWPGGEVLRSEDENPFNKNVDYPAGFDPDTWSIRADDSVYEELGKSYMDSESDSDIDTDEIVVNLGPQHPSTHGVFRLVARR